jgi:hypothetical protein
MFLPISLELVRTNVIKGEMLYFLDSNQGLRECTESNIPKENGEFQSEYAVLFGYNEYTEKHYPIKNKSGREWWKDEDWIKDVAKWNDRVYAYRKKLREEASKVKEEPLEFTVDHKGFKFVQESDSDFLKIRLDDHFNLTWNNENEDLNLYALNHDCKLIRYQGSLNKTGTHCITDVLEAKCLYFRHRRSNTLLPVANISGEKWWERDLTREKVEAWNEFVESPDRKPLEMEHGHQVHGFISPNSVNDQPIRMNANGKSEGYARIVLGSRKLDKVVFKGNPRKCYDVPQQGLVRWFESTGKWVPVKYEAIPKWWQEAGWSKIIESINEKEQERQRAEREAEEAKKAKQETNKEPLMSDLKMTSKYGVLRDSDYHAPISTKSKDMWVGVTFNIKGEPTTPIAKLTDDGYLILLDVKGEPGKCHKADMKNIVRWNGLSEAWGPMKSENLDNEWHKNCEAIELWNARVHGNPCVESVPEMGPVDIEMKPGFGGSSTTEAVTPKNIAQVSRETYQHTGRGTVTKTGGELPNQGLFQAYPEESMKTNLN